MEEIYYGVWQCAEEYCNVGFMNDDQSLDNGGSGGCIEIISNPFCI